MVVGALLDASEPVADNAIEELVDAPWRAEATRRRPGSCGRKRSAPSAGTVPGNNTNPAWSHQRPGRRHSPPTDYRDLVMTSRQPIRMAQPSRRADAVAAKQPRRARGRQPPT